MFTRAMRLFAVGVVAPVALTFSLAAKASGQSPPPVVVNPHAPPKVVPYGDPKSARAGRLEGSVYTNDYFGFQMTIPEGWRVADAEGVAQIGEAGAEAISGGSPEKRAQASAAYQRVVKLLTVGELVQDEKGATTAMLMIGAEPIASWLIASGRDYNNVLKQQLLSSPLKYEVEETMGTETIGGVEFAVMSARSESSAGVLVKQKFYAIVRKGHALFFVSTYVSDKAVKDIAEVLKAVKFH
jgi:hypothetical protein